MANAITAFTAPVTSLVDGLLAGIPGLVTSALPILGGFMALRLGIGLVRRFAH